MAKKLYDLAVKTGAYTNKNGEEKGRWLNVGAVMLSDDGSKFIMLQRTFNPAGVPDLSGRGGESVLLSMFEPKDKDDNGNAASASKPQRERLSNHTVADLDDDIPF